jgi:hypothetical protein
MIENKIYACLVADTTIARIVNTRIYPLVMPQNPTLPAITYQRISNNPLNGLAGYLGMYNPHIMINSWGTAYDVVKELAEDVHDSINTSTAFKAILVSDIDGYDPDVNLYLVSQDYSFWD